MRENQIALASAAFLCACSPAEVSRCPAPIVGATRLVVVTAPSMESASATLETFERATPASAWVRRSAREPVVVGTKGLGWGFGFRGSAQPGEPIKTEGDKRAPAGVFRIGPPFGFEGAPLKNFVKLETNGHVCVDDPASPHYSAIVSRATAGVGTRGEEMWTIPVYKRGLVIDYPTDAASRAGSCIFLHIWEGEGQGTSGCLALPEARVAWLQTWASGAPAAIAIVPEQARERFASCLPQVNDSAILSPHSRSAGGEG